MGDESVGLDYRMESPKNFKTFLIKVFVFILNKINEYALVQMFLST